MTGAGFVRAGALDGVRVLDLIDGMGAYAARLLLGLGAEVVRVEHPGGSRHRHRHWVTPPGQEEAMRSGSLYFAHYHAGMKGVTLDPTVSDGRGILEALLDDVDIVLDNGELARWGVDLDALASKQNPLVVVSLTPFGLHGQRAQWQGTDLVCQAMSGMLGLFGYYDERPARFGPEQASELGGLAAALGAMLALYGVRHSGHGDVVDIAVERVCALVTFQMWNASIFDQFGFTRDRAPRTPGLPIGLYEAADGYFALSTWREVDRTLGLLDTTGFADGLRALRSQVGDTEFVQRDESNEAVRRFTRSFKRQELLKLVQSAGIAGLPVNDAADLLADPFLQARGTFVEIEIDGLPAPLLDAGTPFRLSAAPYAPGRRPPLLGEHNQEVLGGLGYSEHALTDLSERGVI